MAMSVRTEWPMTGVGKECLMWEVRVTVGGAISKHLDKKTGREQTSKQYSSMVSVSDPVWDSSCLASVTHCVLAV